MGCNCGDNEYNIEIENNGSCEPTTPIYNITLANVGVDGFSPLVEFVDVTDASFRIQTTDKNGINVSDPIPLSSYVESNFAKLASANTFTANNTFDGLVFFNNTVYTDRLYSRTLTSPLIIGGNSSTITLGANSTTANYHGSEIVNTNTLNSTLSSYATTIDVTDAINNYDTNRVANTYLKKDGSNASSNFTINSTTIDNFGRIIGNSNGALYLRDAGGNTSLSVNSQGVSMLNNIGQSFTINNKQIATVDQIPDTSSFVTINTAQTITGSKTFSNNISIQANSGGAGSILGVGENYAVGLIGFTTSGTIQVGSSSSELYLNGALDRPSYNGVDLALRSDIPSLTGYATEQWVTNQNYVTNSTLTTTLENYQPLLVSGTNIKTINNQSLLGSGNIDIQGGGGGSVTNPISFSATSGTRTGTITFGIDETNTYPILKYEYNLGSVTIPVNLLTVATNGDGLNEVSVTREGILRRTFSVDSTVERTTNKVTALSADLTDTQYPSAKLFFDTVTALTQVIFQLDSRITALENNINGGNA